MKRVLCIIACVVCTLLAGIFAINEVEPISAQSHVTAHQQITPQVCMLMALADGSGVVTDVIPEQPCRRSLPVNTPLLVGAAGEVAQAEVCSHYPCRTHESQGSVDSTAPITTPSISVSTPSAVNEPVNEPVNGSAWDGYCCCHWWCILLLLVSNVCTALIVRRWYLRQRVNKR